MWFCLFALILVLTITFFQGLQGLFSAVITCLLTMLSVALAFGLYETLYFSFLLERQPDHGRAIALMAVFLVSLLVLRFLFDSIITGNMHFPLYVDRIGGGVVGLITAMLIVGMLAIGIQMLPFGPSFMGFSRYTLIPSDDATRQMITEANTNPDAEHGLRANLDWSKIKRLRNSVWLGPDTFTASLASFLSNNSLAGTTSLSEVYPDLIESLDAARSGPYAESRESVPVNALSIKAYWDLKPADFYTAVRSKAGGDATITLKKASAPDSGTKRLAVRVSITNDARDSDQTQRFSTNQVRLVARSRKGGPTQQFFLSGINDERYPRCYVQLSPGEPVTRVSPSGADQFDFVFTVPDREDFQPLYVEFKQNARAELLPSQDFNNKSIQPLPAPKSKGKPADGAAPNAPPPANTPPANAPKIEPKDSASSDAASPTRSDGRMQDRVSGLGPAKAAESGFFSQLPLTLTNYTEIRATEKSGDRLVGGQILAKLDKNWQPLAGNQPPISMLEVSEGKRLLQLSVEKLQPRSWLGQLYGGMVTSIQNFYLIDSNGKEYLPSGAYAIANVDGDVYFELVYMNHEERVAGHLQKFSKIKSRHLEDNYVLYYLFEVPPGTVAKKLNTGRQSVDLTDLNLAAPN